MAHFAEIDENNIVIRVIVVSNEDCNGGIFPESEQPGVQFCKNLLGGNWKQTSFNSNFRNCFAGIGFIYDEIKDEFVNPEIEISKLKIAQDEAYNYITGSTIN